jgi:predicted methyltransferase MtxX (methanogen marker protein 4)
MSKKDKKEKLTKVIEEAEKEGIEVEVVEETKKEKPVVNSLSNRYE